MKTFGIVLILLLTASTLPAEAQEKMKYPTLKSRIAYAQKNMAVGLRSDNPGVVESTLMIVAKMKMTNPSVHIPHLLSIIDDIAVKHPSASVRYKAYLVSNICADPSWFAHEQSLNTSETDLFYISAAQRLQYKMLDIGSL